MANDMSTDAPPLYGEHRLDPLYSDVDPSGYMTSGINTEGNTPSNNRSRVNSAEDLASLNVRLGENLPSLNAIRSGEFPAHLLSSRLNNLQSPGSSRWTPERNQTSGQSMPLRGPVGTDTDPSSAGNTFVNSDNVVQSGSSSSRHSPRDPLSRRHSAESSSPEPPEHLEISAAELSRVPSYHTAMQAYHKSSLSVDLPNYLHATSRPPTPQTQMPQDPAAAHPAGSLTENAGSPATLRPQRVPSAPGGISLLIAEAERELRRRQARG
jgi:hypothetical protein